MKKGLFFNIFFFVSIAVIGQPNLQSKKMTERYFPDADTLKNSTPALKKSKGFTDYDELVAFLDNLQKIRPELVSLSYIGESQKGYRIPLIHLNDKNQTKSKLKVWLQGGLHGNEPASTEGLLYLLNELVTNPKLNYLFENIEIAALPMANIDGYLVYDRYAANGLDLNRDQTKLMAPESVVLKKTFSDFKAEVAIDFHEYNPFRKDFTKLSTFGVVSLYDVMFLNSGNLNVPEKTRKLTDSLFMYNSMKALDKNNLRHHEYVSTTNHRGEIHFNQASNSARSSATSYALTNAVSSLIEVRGVNINRTSFKRRIATTYIVGLSYLETAAKNIDVVKQTLQETSEVTKDIAVTTDKAVYKDTLKFIDIDTQDLIDLEVTIRDAAALKPKLVRSMPAAYIIQADQIVLVEKIKVLGLQVEQFEQDTTQQVEVFTISSYDKDTVKTEKMNMQTVEASLETKQMNFAKGTFIIYTNQKNKSLLAEVLEPEAPNSFVSFGVLETSLNKELPIYRLLKTN